MKHSCKLLFIGVVLITAFVSCNNDKPLMKNITGKSGELVIVIPKETWDGPSGKLLKDVMAQPQLALPQDEPIFDLIDVPPSAFTDIFKSTRNILTVRISSSIEKSGVEFKKDVWAHPQAVVNINAKTQAEFDTVFTNNSDKIVAFFLKAEKDRGMENYRNYRDNVVYNTLLKNFDIKLNLPVGFKIARKDTAFAWARYETPEISQWVMVYTYKYESDSTFTPAYLVAKRNEVMKKYVPGPRKGSYMSTQKDIAPVLSIFELNGNYAAEMRGLWETENDYMGGPFVSISVLDASKNRIVTVEGSVYAPRYDKRNYLRQVESMIYSLEFTDQAKNDKISSQIKSSNL